MLMLRAQAVNRIVNSFFILGCVVIDILLLGVAMESQLTELLIVRTSAYWMVAVFDGLND